MKNAAMESHPDLRIREANAAFAQDSQQVPESFTNTKRVAICLAGLLFGLAMPGFGQAQFTPASTDGKDSAALQPLPSDKMPGPFPRAELGCRYLKNGEWVEMSCASEEDMKAHNLAKPVVGNSIQSLPVVRGYDDFKPIIDTIPFVWGSVAVTLSNPAEATEVDIPQATTSNPHPTPTSNKFSIQNNTNSFPCTTCKDGYPFAEKSGVANSASQAGDQGWVQFTYQQQDPSLAFVCVWNVDLNVAGDTANAAGYAPTCAELPTPFPLTGKGAPSQTAEVIGWVICSFPNIPCLLSTIAYMPWNDLWLNVVAVDTMGLAGQWTNVSGGIIGEGDSSKASFGNTQVANALRGYSCVEPYTPPLGVFTPMTCPVDYLAPQLFGEAVNSYPTGESSNLTNGPATLTCPAGSFSCSVSFTETAP